MTGIERQAIDQCVNHCPWPDRPGMCVSCRGDPVRIARLKKEAERREERAKKPPAGRPAGYLRLAVLWLEWRARDPSNPDPERTREILTMLRREK